MRRRRRFRGARPRPDQVRLPRQAKTGTFYVYRIVVNGQPYIGFTSRNPNVRLSEHLENARNGNRGKLYNFLRRYNHEHSFEVLKEFKSEYDALCYEINQIADLDTCLNTSPGGEGATMILEQVTLPSGEKLISRRVRHCHS